MLELFKKFLHWFNESSQTPNGNLSKLESDTINSTLNTEHQQCYDDCCADDHNVINSSITDNLTYQEINPATGLPSTNGIDIAGNVFGSNNLNNIDSFGGSSFSSSYDSFSSSSYDSFSSSNSYDSFNNNGFS